MTSRTKEELISVREAAKQCGRNMETVRRWIWAGKLPAEKLGNQLFIKRGDFTSFCRETAVRQYKAEAKTKPGSKANLIKKMRRLREDIRARTGKVFDAETMIRELRDERDREVS